MSRERFEPMYDEGRPPWDIDGPQPAVVALEESGEIRTPVLDAGCGTGENVLYLASRGYDVLGLDVVPAALARAEAKAVARGLPALFQQGDALRLADLGATFATVIDCGLFHSFDDASRSAYVASLAAVVRPGGRVHILCFSDEEPPGQGPRRVTQGEIRDAFRDGWHVASIRAARFQTVDHPEARTFSPGGPRAWLATIERLGDAGEA